MDAESDSHPKTLGRGPNRLARNRQSRVGLARRQPRALGGCRCLRAHRRREQARLLPGVGATGKDDGERADHRRKAPLPARLHFLGQPRGRGGAQFWSVYVPITFTGQAAVQATLELIDAVYTMIERYADQLILVTSADGLDQTT